MIEELNTITDISITEIELITSKIVENVSFERNQFAHIFTVFYQAESSEYRFSLDYVNAESHEVDVKIKITLLGKYYIDRDGDWYELKKSFRNTRYDKIDMLKHAVEFHLLLTRLIELEVERRKIYYDSLDGYKSDIDIQQEIENDKLSKEIKK